MKLLLILLLWPLLAFSQLRLSSEIDPRNALFGGTVNEAAYNGTFSLGYRIDNVLFQASYETFKEIEYQSYTLHVGMVFNKEKKLNYIAMAGISMIERHVNWLHIVWHPAVVVSGQVEYHLGPVFFTARPELRFRGDLDKIIFSGFVGLGVKL